jgi:hypothetical protein
MVGAISNEGLSEQLRFTNIFKGTRSSFRCTRVSGTSISSGPGGPMSVCYHRGVREQWYLYRKYLKLTPRAFLCASIHNPEKWITTRAVLVQVIVGGRVLKKWPCGREYHLIRIYWSLPHRQGVYCAERSHALRLDLRTGLFPERSLLYFLYFRSLWCNESDPQVSLRATLPRVKGCRHESRI